MDPKDTQLIMRGLSLMMLAHVPDDVGMRMLIGDTADQLSERADQLRLEPQPMINANNRIWGVALEDIPKGETGWVRLGPGPI